VQEPPVKRTKREEQANPLRTDVAEIYAVIRIAAQKFARTPEEVKMRGKAGEVRNRCSRYAACACVIRDGVPAEGEARTMSPVGGGERCARRSASRQDIC